MKEKEEKKITAALAAKTSNVAERQAKEHTMAEESTVSGQALTEQAKQAARKKIAEMNLLDDFLFGSVVTYPEIGERFVRILLKTIF